MIFTYTTRFKNDYARLSKGLRDKVYERLAVYIVDEFDPILNNHKLKYEFEGYRSINITGDWRLILRKINDQLCELRSIGTHHQLFGK